MSTPEAETGHSLKVMRVSRRLRAQHVADAMNVSRSRVYSIEREQFPTDEVVRRYVAALDTCATSPTSR